MRRATRIACCRPRTRCAALRLIHPEGPWHVSAKREKGFTGKVYAPDAEGGAAGYANAAGLLSRMGFAARVEPAFTSTAQTRPVVALVTDAPPVLIGHAVSQVATDPEPHLPMASAKVARPKQWEPGDPQFAWWV